MEEVKLKQKTKSKLIKLILELDEKLKTQPIPFGEVKIESSIGAPSIKVKFVSIEDVFNYDRLTDLRKRAHTSVARAPSTPNSIEANMLFEEFLEEMAKDGFVLTSAVYVNLFGSASKLIFYKFI